MKEVHPGLRRRLETGWKSFRSDDADALRVFHIGDFVVVVVFFVTNG